MQAALPWISRPASFFTVLLCTLWSYVIILWCGCILPCFSCSFSVAGFVCFFVCFFPSDQTIDNADWGVVAKIEFMATQNNRGAKTSLIASLGFSHVPLSGPCHSLENNSPRLSAKWFERSPEQNFKEVITSRSQAYPKLREHRFFPNIIQNN